MEWSAPELTARVLRRQRIVLVGAIAALVAISCAFLIRGGGMDDSGAMADMRPSLAAAVAMWWTMMAAMMLPSATPAILLYDRVREARGEAGRIAPTWLFLSAYLLVWLGFSLAAAATQLLVAGPDMRIGNRLARAAILVAAGIYQFSPMKRACLSFCRSPAQFLSRHWRPGTAGALRLGLAHGAYCLGCCWALMLLLFVGGVMNLPLVAILAALVAAEKLLPRGEWLARATGLGLILWGVATLALA